MTEEQKQELIARLRVYIRTTETSIRAGLAFEKDIFNLQVRKIALAALTAQPVKQPDTKCIGWVKETIYEHNQKWRDAIRAAGYEVQE